jgi:hypothetical protein
MTDSTGAGQVTTLRSDSQWPNWPYVSQFLLGPSHAEHLENWQRREILGSALKLTLHPALNCIQISAGPRQLTLVGHMLDPRSPEATNEDILRALLAQFSDRERLIQATARLGGRWLVIAATETEQFLFHDALGLRQVFYTDPARVGALWAASQPGLVNDMVPLTPDPLALDYMDTHTFRYSWEYRWPGAASTFDALAHLLPNHWLDLGSGRAERYWPTSPLQAYSPEDAIDRLHRLLSGQIDALTRRFDLALSITAGFDSRVVLGAARQFVDRLCVMTLRQGRLPDGHSDITVPARLLERLGIRHQVVRATSTMTPEFSLAYKRNVYWAHDHYGHDAEAILKCFDRRYATITGSGAEVARCPFRVKLPHADQVRLTPHTLAWLEYGSTHPFLTAHFEAWLDDASRQHFVKLLDLFEWEQDYGNWLAMVQLEFDVAWREIFTPYNCRELFETLLGVDESFRQPRDPALWRMYLKRVWPDLLSEPINPHRAIGRLEETVADMKAVRRYWRFSREQRRQTGRRI